MHDTTDGISTTVTPPATCYHTLSKLPPHLLGCVHHVGDGSVHSLDDGGLGGLTGLAHCGALVGGIVRQQLWVIWHIVLLGLQTVGRHNETTTFFLPKKCVMSRQCALDRAMRQEPRCHQHKRMLNPSPWQGMTANRPGNQLHSACRRLPHLCVLAVALGVLAGLLVVRHVRAEQVLQAVAPHLQWDTTDLVLSVHNKILQSTTRLASG